MKHTTSQHIEIEDGEKPSTVVIDNKNYDTVVITVLDGEGEELHSLEVEDWVHETELDMVE